MSKRKRGRRRKPRRSSRPSARSSSSEYRQAVRKADQVLSINDVEIQSDNWQRLALDWFAPDEPDRSEMARYIAAHERQLGVAWARELLRLEVFYSNALSPRLGGGSARELARGTPPRREMGVV